MKNKGITLIALVITIVILILLAGISISVLTGENGIITKAKQARQNMENAAIEEQEYLNTLYDNLGSDTIGTGSYDEAASLIQFKRKIAEAITSMGIATSENDSADAMATNIRQINKTEENITIAEVSTIAEAKSKNATAVGTVVTLKDDNNKNVKIPAGFKIASDSAIVVSDGIVIEDTKGNQFVWIPVDNIADYTRRAYGTNIMTTTLDETTNSYQIKENSSSDKYFIEAMPNDEYTSVNVNKGYYIGRYETGDSTIPTASFSNLRNANSGLHNAVCIKKGYAPYNYINFSDAQNLAEKFDTIHGYTGITGTKLCSSYAWDTAIWFIEQTVSNYGSNSPQGNYKDVDKSYIDITGTTQTVSSGTSAGVIPTGQTIAVCNIYDMGGNVAEFTQESAASENASRIYTTRGSYYGYSVRYFSAGRRNDDSYIYSQQNGFRITLFL